jgi:hypothetical protein
VLHPELLIQLWLVLVEMVEPLHQLVAFVEKTMVMLCLTLVFQQLLLLAGVEDIKVVVLTAVRD